MAHELTLNAGVAEMAFTGDRNQIWHGLGQQLQDGASIDEWKIAAGMNWNISRAAEKFVIGSTEKMDILTGQPVTQYEYGTDDSTHVLFRSDNKRKLGTVSAGYKTVEPGETLEFFRNLVEGQGFKMSTAGTLFGGKRFWALASVGESAYIAGNSDAIGGYLLLSTSCDGTSATEARFTTVRVVCNNTLSMATSSKATGQVVKLSHRSVFDPAAMKDKLGIATDNFAQFMVASRNLAKTGIDQNKARQFIESLIYAPNMLVGDQSTQAKNKVDAILSLYNGKGIGSDLDSAKGTAWGLVNAVTEYVDHHAPVRGKDANDNRFDNAMFGKGDDLKTQAFEQALALV